MSDQGEERIVLATNEDLRQILLRINSTLVYGSSLVAVTLAVAWGFLGMSEDVSVPTMLPILTIAAVLFAAMALSMEEQVQKIGRPHRAKVR
ncbi:MAG TPA: hypothetical protein VD864_06585 [Nocardioides sp.]|nr:hypothetical protein [Nocardioides sp.]